MDSPGCTQESLATKTHLNISFLHVMFPQFTPSWLYYPFLLSLFLTLCAPDSCLHAPVLLGDRAKGLVKAVLFNKTGKKRSLWLWKWQEGWRGTAQKWWSRCTERTADICSVISPGTSSQLLHCSLELISRSYYQAVFIRADEQAVALI